MPHPQVMFKLRLLAALSWSDGTLADEERGSLERLIGASELDDDERATAESWLAGPVELDTGAISSLSENQRLASYQAAVRMALRDETLDPAERSFLDRARDALGLTSDQAGDVEADFLS